MNIGRTVLKRQSSKLLLFAVFYAVSLLLGLSVLSPAGKTAVIWPAGGFLLGFLVTVPRSHWLKILLVGYGITLLIEAGILERSFTLITIFFATNTIEAVLGALVFQQYCGGQKTFQSIKQLVIFLIVVVSGIPLVTAAIATTTIIRLTPATNWGAVYYSWYSSAGLGILFVSPCAIALIQGWQSCWRSPLQEKLEFLSILLIAVVLSLFQFGDLAQTTQFTIQPYMIFPVLMWAALRFETAGVAFAGLLWTTVAVWQINLDHPPPLMHSQGFGGETWKLQLLILVVALASIGFAVALRQVKEALMLKNQAEALAAERTEISKQTQARYQRLFTMSEVGILEEDFSAVLTALEALRQSGVTHLRDYLQQNRQQAWDLAALVEVVEVNPATLALFKAQTRQEYLQDIGKTFGPNTINVFIDALCAIWDNHSIFRSEAHYYTLDGQELVTLISMPIPQNLEDSHHVPFSILDITERKHSEEALKQSKERYQGLVEDIPTLLCRYLPGGELTFVNQAYADYFGQTVESLVGTNFLNLIPEANRAAVWANLEQLTIEMATQTQEHPVIHPDGRPRWQRWTDRALFDDQGNIRAYQAIGEDITLLHQSQRILALEKRRAEVLLTLPQVAEQMDEAALIRHGLELIEALTESQMAFIHFVHDNSQVLEFVTGSRPTSDPPEIAVPGQRYPPTQIGIWAKGLQQQQPMILNRGLNHGLNDGLSDEFSVDVKHLNASDDPEVASPLLKIAKSFANPMMNIPTIEAGQVVMLTNVVGKRDPYTQVDIETVQLISNELWRLVQHCRITQKLYQAAAVFESTVQGVAITNLEGTILDVNQAFVEITGYGRDEVIGENHRLLQSGYHDRSFYQALWQQLKKQGYWRGEIWNRRRDGSIYPELLTIGTVRNEQGQPTGYVGVFSDITPAKRSEEQLKRLAHHDPLTDLPNRLLLNARLKQSIKRAKRQQQQFALVFIDLDRFKQINDSLGHSSGDLLLQQLSLRLTGSLRADDTVARISGDEFVVLLEDIGSAEGAIVVVRKLVDVFKVPFTLGNQEVYMTASLGISLFPDDGNNAADLLRNADAAMYQAKEEGRNTYCFYAEDVTAAVFEQALTENALKGALNRQEFYLVYQPQVGLRPELSSSISPELQPGGNQEGAAVGALKGMEVLLRWQHSELGLVSPGRFIPLAEQSGLIREIGFWVLRTACIQGKHWLDQGLDFGHLAVNVAGPQIQHRDFVQEVQTALLESGLPAQHLELEITESFVMQHPGERVEQLQRLRNLGIQISIDDFGTGYSSLSYLKQLPIDKLKIDQSFVRDIPEDANDMAIAEAVIALGQALNLQVIAEGVETEDQAQFLREKGCHEAQGYFFSKPVRPDAIEHLLLGHARSRMPSN
ncbi:MAG: EAL domain-containing protein [Leptolyngbyaceae cyanobacterium]